MGTHQDVRRGVQVRHGNAMRLDEKRWRRTGSQSRNSSSHLGGESTFAVCCSVLLTARTGVGLAMTRLPVHGLVIGWLGEKTAVEASTACL
jgi:hypothetical protein